MAKLFYRYAAMNSGKSTQLLQIAFNYESMGKRVDLYTAGIDDRYGVGRITSRLGLHRDAHVFSEMTDFLALDTENLDCLLIDEAQFLQPIQVQQLHELAHTKNIPVLAFGLRSDFAGNPFPGAAYLMSLAEDLEEIKTICQCGKKATMHIRMNADGTRVKEGPQVEIGGDTRYHSVCARCFYQG